MDSKYRGDIQEREGGREKRGRERKEEEFDEGREGSKREMGGEKLNIIYPFITFSGEHMDQ